MSKYAALIKAAKEDEGGEEEKKEKKVRKPKIQTSGKPENQIKREVKPKDVQEEQVNLGVKVPLSWRRHWAAESKKTGVTMTEIIVEALTARFGKP